MHRDREELGVWLVVSHYLLCFCLALTESQSHHDLDNK